jgi:hypothetical protein
MVAGFHTVKPGGVLAVITIGDFSKSEAGASAFRAIVTDHPIEEMANVNVMYAADGHIYMHVPGDKIGSLTISGVAFAGLCQAGGAGGDDGTTYNMTDDMTGFERVLRWYRANRVSNASKNDPIEVTLGGGTILKGYLGSFSARIADVAHRLYAFTLPMFLVPDDSISPSDVNPNWDISPNQPIA